MLEKVKAWIKGLFTKKDRRNPIERRIDELAERMKNFDETSDDYKEMAETLTKLTEANAKVKEHQKKGLSWDVLFNGGIAFLQIIVILIWEERHVIRSGAIKFVTKLVGRK